MGPVSEGPAAPRRRRPRLLACGACGAPPGGGRRLHSGVSADICDRCAAILWTQHQRWIVAPPALRSFPVAPWELWSGRCPFCLARAGSDRLYRLESLRMCTTCIERAHRGFRAADGRQLLVDAR